MWRDAWLVMVKDLRIEARSRVGLGQIGPMALLILVLFAFALGADKSALQSGAPGLYWVAVLFAAVIATQRTFAIERADGARDGLRLLGLDPVGTFIGKAMALAVQLVILEVVLTGGIAILYGEQLSSLVLLGAAAVAATVGLSAAAVAYGALAAGTRVSETLLPLLLLPVLAPVLLAATEVWKAGLAGHGSDGEPWMRLLAVFAAVYLVVGAVSFGPLMEEG